MGHPLAPHLPRPVSDLDVRPAGVGECLGLGACRGVPAQMIAEYAAAAAAQLALQEFAIDVPLVVRGQ